MEIKTAPHTKPFIVVGIPAFNEEQTIARVILEAKQFASQVIVCDDGSTDYTAEIAAGLGAEVICHEKNGGYGASIRSLFMRAHELRADIFVTLDADGQHAPNEIPYVIKPILDGAADIVIGSRFVGERGTAEMPLYRQIGAKLITKMVNGSAKNGVTDAQSGFRAYSYQALNLLNFSENGMGASVEILLKASKSDLRIVEVPSTCKYKNGDVSTSTEHPLTHGIGVIWSLVRLVVEERPLLMLGIPSLLCLLAGVGFGLWMLQIYATVHSIETNIALASVSFILIGFFLLSTAITLYAILRMSERFSMQRGNAY
ncbi:MAG: glycosyltransferase family 2 protein [Candidatus Bathyarchaeota archaeon]|nr:glycosyltransferase family 2 protein [Candidatus Bathyarchaeota archaeon]